MEGRVGEEREVEEREVEEREVEEREGRREVEEGVGGGGEGWR